MTADWSELDLIALFAGKNGAADTPGLVEGIGDDCAIFTGEDGRHWLVTTDMLVEDVHFDRSWHPAHLLGRKSMAVNLSDIAAMGGTPLYALTSIAIPEQIDRVWLEQWSDGAAEILKQFGCRLIGGDTVRGPVLTINIVLLGSAARESAILRSSAREGENIYVSGNLGSAGAGLEICRQPELFSSFTDDELQPFRENHLNPTPRVELGQVLAASGMVGAMQDISDGLASDLAHICSRSHIGAEVQADLLSAERTLAGVCRCLKRPAVELQLSGGEDYELLFTVRQGRDEELLSLVQERNREVVHRVGSTVPGSTVLLRSADGVSDIAFQGYQHSGRDS